MTYRNKDDQTGLYAQIKEPSLKGTSLFETVTLLTQNGQLNDIDGKTNEINNLFDLMADEAREAKIN